MADVELQRYEFPENFIYLYHLKNRSGKYGTILYIPAYADSIQDIQNVSFSQSTPLARSAPIFSYQNSGPRTINIKFQLHRDLMSQLNSQQSNAPVVDGDDYVDTLIKCLQACVVPTYDASSKLVNPPMVALCMGNDIFIKGIISGNLGLTYNLPILRNGKYAVVDVAFEIKEIEPYDAELVSKVGSFRGLNTSLQRNVYKV